MREISVNLSRDESLETEGLFGLLQLDVSLRGHLCHFDQNRLVSARAAHALISIDWRITDALPGDAQSPGWGVPGAVMRD
jgi:hypothetical protein